MKNKSLNIFIFSLLILMACNFISANSYSIQNKSAPENSELNWYFVNRGNNQSPECPKESAEFLDTYDAYYVGDTENKIIYLTFDEGYENGYTVKILDVLKEENVPAAFFVVKPYIIQNPEIIKRMNLEGHLVCNHSSHHPSMASITDKEKFIKEFTEVEDAYKEITDSEMPKFFRPPMGKYSLTSLKQTKELGYKTIFGALPIKIGLLIINQAKKWLLKRLPLEFILAVSCFFMLYLKPIPMS